MINYLQNFDKIVDKECLKLKKNKLVREKRIVDGYIIRDGNNNILSKTPINFRQYQSLLNKYGVFEKVEQVETLDQLFYNLMFSYSYDEVNAMMDFINRVGWAETDVKYAYETLSGKESQARNLFENILELLQYYTPPPPPPPTPPSSATTTPPSSATTTPSATRPPSPRSTRPASPTPPDEDEGILGRIEEILGGAATGTYFGGVPELPTTREMVRGEFQRAAQERLEGRPTQLTMTGFAGRPQTTLLSGDPFQLELPAERYVLPTISRDYFGSFI